MLQRQIYPSTVPPVKNKSSQRRRKTFQKNMGVDDKNISYRIYLVAAFIFVIAVAITIKLTNIQWAEIIIEN
jgi:hypothetical protein